MIKRYTHANYFIENNEYATQKLDIEIKLLNWNIQKKNSNDNWIKDIKNLTEKYEPSIILFQECQFIKGLEKILHLEKYGFVFAPNFVDIFNNKHSGVLTGSRSSHRRITVIKSHAFEPILRVPKIFLSTTYEIESINQELLVINIHAINFVGFWKFISQIQQLENTINNHLGPVIVSGDFNTWNLRRSAILNQILMAIGLRKVEFDPINIKMIKKFLFKNPLDHIYFKGMKIKEPPFVIKTQSSDHNPLIVTFILNS